MPKIDKTLVKIRAFLANPNVRYWLPKRKVLAGALASVLVLAARSAGVLDGLPSGWSETIAYAIVAYLVPEYDEPTYLFQPDPVNGRTTLP